MALTTNHRYAILPARTFVHASSRLEPGGGRKQERTRTNESGTVLVPKRGCPSRQSLSASKSGGPCTRAYRRVGSVHANPEPPGFIQGRSQVNCISSPGNKQGTAPLMAPGQRLGPSVNANRANRAA